MDTSDWELDLTKGLAARPNEVILLRRKGDSVRLCLGTGPRTFVFCESAFILLVWLIATFLIV